jgi:hypothetical protein
VSILLTEGGDSVLLFCVDAFEIVDGCEEDRDICNAVFGRRSICLILGRI